MTTPEDQAREKIDELLGKAAWAIQDLNQTNLNAARGVAIRNFPLERGHGFADYLLPITAGAFIYIAGSDLIPELNQHHSHSASQSALQLLMMVLGARVMLLPGLLEGWLRAY